MIFNSLDKSNMEVRMKKGDVLFIILIVSIAVLFFFFRSKRNPGEYAIVTVDGKTEKYSLSENRILQFENEKGEENTVVIQEHQVYMKEASCPDQICVRHKAISKNGESIICLPNEVFIEIQSKEQKETDN